MTKRELIEALEALNCADNTEVEIVVEGYIIEPVRSVTLDTHTPITNPTIYILLE